MKITHDLHIHTYLSLCAPDKNGTVENYVASAKRQGLKKLGFANHFWGTEFGNKEYYENVRANPTHFYTVQNFEHISQIKSDMQAAKGEGIELLFGAEAEYDPCARTVAVTPEQAEQMDFIIVPNSHTHMTMPKSCYEPYEKHKEFMFQAFYDIINSEVSRYITAIAHPFHAVCCPYGAEILMQLITDDEYKRAFDSAANKGIAMEFNMFSVVKSNPEDISVYNEEVRMLRIAKECGCKFTFGSDAHTISEHENIRNFDVGADLLGLCEDDIAEKAR